MNERPTSVTVFAIINLILSVIGLLGFIHWLTMQLGLLPVPEAQDAVTRAMQHHTGFQLFTNVMQGVGIITTILMIAASIAMFSLKNWSRRTTLGLGVYSILIIALGYLLTVVLIVRPLLPDLTGVDLMVARFMMIGGGVMTILFMGYYLLMIFMLTRPKVVQAFTPDLMDHAYNEPGQPPAESGGTPQ